MGQQRAGARSRRGSRCRTITPACRVHRRRSASLQCGCRLGIALSDGHQVAYARDGQDVDHQCIRPQQDETTTVVRQRPTRCDELPYTGRSEERDAPPCRSTGHSCSLTGLQGGQRPRQRRGSAGDQSCVDQPQWSSGPRHVRAHGREATVRSCVRASSIALEPAQSTGQVPGFMLSHATAGHAAARVSSPLMCRLRKRSSWQVVRGTNGTARPRAALNSSTTRSRRRWIENI
jgi:hypothetical protein